MKKITGRGKLHESDIDEMLREVRLSLLEADVNFRVVKKFLAEVKSKALGAKILDGLNPGQQVVDIVREELKQVLGSEQVELNLNKNGLTVLMLVGLQGAGKTTACGKIALYLRKKYKKTPLLIAADVYRPAAIDQLVTLGKQINVPVYEDGIKTNPRKIVKDGINQAIKQSCDLVIIDTAGRLQVNEELMDELKDIKEIARPHEILLTVDAMSGQDACNVATAFNEKIDLTGIILTKLDGDARGGAALSIKEITGLPIKLMSTGEKLDELEIFYPDRIADRILGMGDVLTLIDTVKENIRFGRWDATDAEIAEAIRGQFPSTPLESLTTSVTSYKAIDAWTDDLTMSEESFNRLQDVMQNAGELSQRADYDDIVYNEIADKIGK